MIKNNWFIWPSQIYDINYVITVQSIDLFGKVQLIELKKYEHYTSLILTTDGLKVLSFLLNHKLSTSRLPDVNSFGMSKNINPIIIL